MSNKKIWIRAGITLHTELKPGEITEEILLNLIENNHWKLDGETLVYQDNCYVACPLTRMVAA